MPAPPGSGSRLPTSTPPDLAWLVTPLSFLPYSWAAWIWTGVLATAFVIVFTLAAPGRGPMQLITGVAAAVLLPVFVGVLFGQVSLLVVAAVALSWWLLSRERPWLAGLALSVLILKPQIAFLVPPALLLAGYWRVAPAWLAVSVPLAVVTLLATGTEVFHQVSQSLHLVSGVPGPIQSSLLRQLPPPAAIIAIAAVLGDSLISLLARPGS